MKEFIANVGSDAQASAKIVGKARNLMGIRRWAGLRMGGMCFVLGAVVGCTTLPPDDDGSVSDPAPEAPSVTPGELLEGKWLIGLDDPTALLVTFDRNGTVTTVELRGGIIFRWTGSSIISSSSKVQGTTVSFSARMSDGVLSEGSIDFRGTFDDAETEEIPGTLNGSLQIRGGGTFGARNEPANMTLQP